MIVVGVVEVVLVLMYYYKILEFLIVFCFVFLVRDGCGYCNNIVCKEGLEVSKSATGLQSLQVLLYNCMA